MKPYLYILIIVLASFFPLHALISLLFTEQHFEYWKCVRKSFQEAL